jgi:hypothetical protein
MASSSAASRLSPLSRRQPGQPSSGASEGISVPHFGQTLITLITAALLAQFFVFTPSKRKSRAELQKSVDQRGKSLLSAVIDYGAWRKGDTYVFNHRFEVVPWLSLRSESQNFGVTLKQPPQVAIT